jgi:hypothetical protein
MYDVVTVLYIVAVNNILEIKNKNLCKLCSWRSKWPLGLRNGSAVAGFLRLWVRITPGAWMSLSCGCCVLSGMGLCVGLITRPKESYRVWCVWVWSRILDTEEALTHWGLLRQGGKTMLLLMLMADANTLLHLTSSSALRLLYPHIKYFILPQCRFIIVLVILLVSKCI